MLWVENISCLLKQKCLEKQMSRKSLKFCATFSEFKVYIFCWNSLYFFILFWKIRIDALYDENVYEEFSSIYALALIFIKKSSFSKPIDSMFSPPPITFFSLCCWNISTFGATDWSCKCPCWVHRNLICVMKSHS